MRRLVIALALLACSPALAQWGYPTRPALQFQINGAPQTGVTTVNAPAGSTLSSGVLTIVGGTGTVTSVTCNAGLTGGTFTTSGTCALDLTRANTWTGQQTFNTAPVIFGAGATASGSSAFNLSGSSGTFTAPAGVFNFNNATVNTLANTNITGATSATNTTGLTLTVAVTDGASSKGFSLLNSTTMTQGNLLTLGHGGGTKLTIDFSGAATFSNTITTANNVLIGAGGALDTSSAGSLRLGGTATSVAVGPNRPFVLASQVFASLGTPTNGSLLYCSDCTVAATCAGSGTGALAKRLNGVWVCN